MNEMNQGWNMGIGWIFLIIAIAIIILLILRFANRYYSRAYSNNKTALDILNERYAKGKISKKEYEEKKNLILYDKPINKQ